MFNSYPYFPRESGPQASFLGEVDPWPSERQLTCTISCRPLGSICLCKRPSISCCRTHRAFVYRVYNKRGKSQAAMRRVHSVR